MSVPRTNILSVNIPTPRGASGRELEKWVLNVAHALRFRRNDRVTTSGAVTATVFDIQAEDAAVYAVKAYVVGRRTAGSGSANQGVVSVLRGTFKVVSGTLSEIAEDTEYSATDIAGASVTFDVSGAKIRLRVTGASGYDIAWRAFTQTLIAR